jgi:midasin (ATPase involved in ribosome maturation)
MHLFSKDKVSALCRCLEHKEPALLVGVTGIGKTTLCQTLAFIRRQDLHVISCNRNTEASDILGGYRPTRRREASVGTFRVAFSQAVRCVAFCNAAAFLKPI